MKRLIWLVSLSFGLSMAFIVNSSVSAASYSNNPPKALRYGWRTKLTKMEHGRDFHHYYEYQSLSVTKGGKNARFQLEGFVLTKKKQSMNNTGPYGVFSSDRWILQYEKVSSHRYYVGGAMQPSFDGAHTPVEAGIVFSKSFKSIKVYLFNVHIHNGHGYRGKGSYVGHFYRGQHSYY